SSLRPETSRAAPELMKILVLAVMAPSPIPTFVRPITPLLIIVEPVNVFWPARYHVPVPTLIMELWPSSLILPANVSVVFFQPTRHVGLAALELPAPMMAVLTPPRSPMSMIALAERELSMTNVPLR